MFTSEGRAKPFPRLLLSLPALIAIGGTFIREDPPMKEDGDPVGKRKRDKESGSLRPGKKQVGK